MLSSTSLRAPGGGVAPPWFDQRRRVRLALARFRVALIVGTTLAGVLAVGIALRPVPPVTEPVLVAARDLPAGARPSSGDLVAARWPAGARPDGALDREAFERQDDPVLAAPVRRGEPLTDARLIGPGLLRGLPAGQVALPLRPADPGAAGLVRVGDRVDVYALAVDGLASGDAGFPGGGEGGVGGGGVDEAGSGVGSGVEEDSGAGAGAGMGRPDGPGGAVARGLRVLARLDGEGDAGGGGSGGGLIDGAPLGGGVGSGGGDGSASGGGLLVLAVPEDEVGSLARASGRPLTVVLRASR